MRVRSSEPRQHTHARAIHTRHGRTCECPACMPSHNNRARMCTHAHTHTGARTHTYKHHRSSSKDCRNSLASFVSALSAPCSSPSCRMPSSLGNIGIGSCRTREVRRFTGPTVDGHAPLMGFWRDTVFRRVLEAFLPPGGPGFSQIYHSFSSEIPKNSLFACL